MQLLDTYIPERAKLLKSAIERSEKFYILKFKSVTNRLLTFEKNNFFNQSQQNFLEDLIKIKSADLLRFGSDFFWASVHRVYNALDAPDKHVLEIMYSFFLQNAFDSFFPLISANSYLKFENFGDDNILFVKLNLCLTGNLDKKIVISKINDKTLKYSLDEAYFAFEGNFHLINLDQVPVHFEIHREIINKNISILYQRHQNIFELAYFFDCTENSFLGHLLKLRLDKAFALIRETDSTLYAKILSSLDFIVPMGNSLKDNHPSFASPLLKKTIFLSLNLIPASDYLIVESIIHEYSHCELHYIQDTVLLTQVENNIIEYYSPWRPDPRPLLGLIHGIYVTHEVICFFNHLLQNDKHSENEKKLVLLKTEILINQLEIAYKQIKKGDLTLFTTKLLQNILFSTETISKQLQIDISNPPAEVLLHKEIWRSTNMPRFQIKE